MSRALCRTPRGGRRAVPRRGARRSEFDAGAAANDRPGVAAPAAGITCPSRPCAWSPESAARAASSTSSAAQLEVSAEKAHRVLGWHRAVGFEEGMVRTAAWLRGRQHAALEIAASCGRCCPRPRARRWFKAARALAIAASTSRTPAVRIRCRLRRGWTPPSSPRWCSSAPLIVAALAGLPRGECLRVAAAWRS